MFSERHNAEASNGCTEAATELNDLECFIIPTRPLHKFVLNFKENFGIKTECCCL